jgi:sterol desaturase/sphingolipid hydroxylase (fatty acid hydroxylase superfamily)
LIVEEIWNYIMHSLLHQKKLYWIHKPHHEYIIPISISGQYIHPIEYITSSALSTALGYKILSRWYPIHIFSIIIWITFRVFETNDSHAGYNWPWIQSALIPGNSGDSYHYFHHRVNVGNYAGIMYFMDSLFGSNNEFWKYENKIKGNFKNRSKILYGK